VETRHGLLRPIGEHHLAFEICGRFSIKKGFQKIDRSISHTVIHGPIQNVYVQHTSKNSGHEHHSMGEVVLHIVMVLALATSTRLLAQTSPSSWPKSSERRESGERGAWLSNWIVEWIRSAKQPGLSIRCGLCWKSSTPGVSIGNCVLLDLPEILDN